MSKEPSDLTKLLRLKRYEIPKDEYFSDFLGEFQRRQRAEILTVSPFTMLWERTVAWVKEASTATLVGGVSAAYAAILLGFLFWPQSPSEERDVVIIPISSEQPMRLRVSQTQTVEFSRFRGQSRTVSQEF